MLRDLAGLVELCVSIFTSQRRGLGIPWWDFVATSSKLLKLDDLHVQMTYQNVPLHNPDFMVVVPDI